MPSGNHLYCCTSKLTTSWTDTSSTTILWPGTPTDPSVSTVLLIQIYSTVLLMQESTRKYGEQSAKVIGDSSWLGWGTPPLPPSSESRRGEQWRLWQWNTIGILLFVLCLLNMILIKQTTLNVKLNFSGLNVNISFHVYRLKWHIQTKLNKIEFGVSMHLLSV